LEDTILENLKNAILNYDTEGAAEWARKIMEAQIDPLKVMNTVTDAIRSVGEKYAKDELWLPDLIGAAAAMKSALPIIENRVIKMGKERATSGSVVIGTVYGDVHSIGKGMVATLLLAEGLTVYDLGVDIKAEIFIDAVKRHKPDILALSALMTTTASEMRKVIEELKNRGLRDQVKIIIGGGPITHEFSQEIGADGFSPTAPGGAKLARKLIEMQKGDR
jgi:methanogenic corrinoid protein MtbC1